MRCDYFDAGRCRSCTLLGIPYAAQLAELDRAVRATLAPMAPGQAWQDPVAGAESGFRNKAKLAVGGRRGSPTLGILDGAGRGVDLQACGLYEPGLAAALPVLADHVADTGLTPYDVPSRTGELKALIVTHSPDGELMVRFVLRSPGQLPKLRRSIPQLQAALPAVRVVSANLLPQHVALLEGDEEIPLTDAETLPMRLRHLGGELTVHLRPRSFFQTNTVVATALYAQARAWTQLVAPRTAWDLYCGAGGFALHLAAAEADAEAEELQVVGIEVSADAVAGARRSAHGRPGLRFEVGDAAAYAMAHPMPDLVVVNPPRRGIGPVLAEHLERAGPRHLLYSSCNADTLAADLQRMPSLRVQRARLFAMFPQTRHHEVLVLASRAAPAG